MDSASVVIIGAGLSGLTAARALTGPDGLLAPAEVLIVERDGEVGGRLATQQIGAATLDHGAQFFTVRSEEFRVDVDRWMEAGWVEEWCRGFAEVDGYPRYRAAGGMQDLAQRLAAELTAAGVAISTDAAVSRLTRRDDRWLIGYDDPARPTTDATSVVATPPAPLTIELLERGGVPLDPEPGGALATFEYHRVIALLTTLDRPAPFPHPGALQQPADPTFTFVADNQAKAVSAQPAVTFHTAHARSAELWEATDDEVAAALVPAAEALVAPAAITELQIKRWRHAGPITPHPQRCLIGVAPQTPNGGPLVVAGDGFGGSKVEGAYLSGLAAAAAVSPG